MTYEEYRKQYSKYYSDEEIDQQIAEAKANYQENLKLIGMTDAELTASKYKHKKPNELDALNKANSLKMLIDRGDFTHVDYLKGLAMAKEAIKAGAKIMDPASSVFAKLSTYTNPKGEEFPGKTLDEYGDYLEKEASKTGMFGSIGSLTNLKDSISNIKSDPGFGSMSGLATTTGQPLIGDISLADSPGMENVIGAGQKPGQTLALHAIGSTGLQNALAPTGTGTGAAGATTAGGAAVATPTATTAASAALPWVIGGSSLLSGYMGSQAAKEASEAATLATQVATDEHARQFDIARADTAVARGAGESATYAMMDELGMNYGAETGALDPESQLPTFGGAGDRFEFNLEADPGYRFARDEGVNEVSKYMASKGKRFSGNVLAAIGDRTAGIASQYAPQAFQRQMATENLNYGRDVGEFGIEYQRAGDVYGRRQDYLNRLAAMAGMGQTATGQSINAGGNMANAIGNIQMANAQAQGGAAGTKYGAINDAVQGGIGNWLTYQQQHEFVGRPPVAPQQPTQYIT